MHLMPRLRFWGPPRLPTLELNFLSGAPLECNDLDQSAEQNAASQYPLEVIQSTPDLASVSAAKARADGVRNYNSTRASILPAPVGLYI